MEPSSLAYTPQRSGLAISRDGGPTNSDSPYRRITSALKLSTNADGQLVLEAKLSGQSSSVQPSLPSTPKKASDMGFDSRSSSQAGRFTASDGRLVPSSSLTLSPSGALTPRSVDSPAPSSAQRPTNTSKPTSLLSAFKISDLSLSRDSSLSSGRLPGAPASIFKIPNGAVATPIEAVAGPPQEQPKVPAPAPATPNCSLDTHAPLPRVRDGGLYTLLRTPQNFSDLRDCTRNDLISYRSPTHTKPTTGTLFAQDKLVALTVLPGSYSAEAAEAVAHIPSGELRSLVLRGILDIDTRTGRYSLKPSARADASTDPESNRAITAPARVRHAEWTSGFLRSLAPVYESKDFLAALEALDEERAHVDQLLAWVSDADPPLTESAGAAWAAAGDALAQTFSLLSARVPAKVLLRTFDRALTRCPDTCGDHTRANYLFCSACALATVGDAAPALERHRQALELRQMTPGAAQTLEVAASEAAAGRALLQIPSTRSKLDALHHFQRAFKIRLKLRGAEAPDTAASFVDIGMILQSQGKLAEGWTQLSRAHAILLRTIGPDHPHLAACLLAMGGNLRAQGRAPEALEHTQRAVAIRVATHGESHPLTADALLSLGHLQNSMRSYNDALASYERCFKIRAREVGQSHESTATAYLAIADLLRSRGKCDQAADLYRKVLEIKVRSLGERHLEVALLRLSLAGCYKLLHNYDGALQELETALEIQREVLDPADPQMCKTIASIASCYVQLKRRVQRVLFFIVGLVPMCSSIRYDSLPLS